MKIQLYNEHHQKQKGRCRASKRKLGFGLIEMLVVVGAISALAAIGYPTVEKSFEKSKESNDITAMQSADSLITSASLSGKMIGGKPARDYTRDNPL